MSALIDQLKEKVKEILPQVELVIGYQRGADELHTTPLFIRRPEEVEKLVWNKFCIPNLADYLAPQKQFIVPPLAGDDKVGVILKGCDSRSVNQLLQEGVIKRRQLVVIGIPCEGKIDVRKLSKKVDLGSTLRVQVDKQTIVVVSEQGEFSADLTDLLYDKCQACKYPNPFLEDVFVGQPATDKHDHKLLYQPVKELEKLSPPELRDFWQKQFERCIRCYACRNACPMCYCHNQCLIEARNPHWVGQQVAPKENRFFHMMRAMHLAGRCTDCGECARVCPMEIPLDLLTRKINMELMELFAYQAGIDPEIKPPLVTFQVEEPWEKDK